jgi:hypothetical protein
LHRDWRRRGGIRLSRRERGLLTLPLVTQRSEFPAGLIGGGPQRRHGTRIFRDLCLKDLDLAANLVWRRGDDGVRR